MGNPTKFEHYNFYPVCGWCLNAWDMVYQRTRSRISMRVWLDLCRHSGCDPDVWDYLNDATGWPRGWKVSRKTGLPNFSKLPDPPKVDNRVFHRRDDDGPNAKWRRTSNALRNKAIEYKAELRDVDPVDLAEWDDEDQDNSLIVDLADPDIW